MTQYNVKYTLENTKGAIKKGQSRKTGNIGYKNEKQNKNTTQHVSGTTKCFLFFSSSQEYTHTNRINARKIFWQYNDTDNFSI